MAEPTIDEVRTTLAGLLARADLLTTEEMIAISICIRRIDQWHEMNEKGIAYDNLGEALRKVLGEGPL